MRQLPKAPSATGSKRSSNGSASPHSQERPLLHLVHGPWNRKSMATILSQQQHSYYGGSDRETSTPTQAETERQHPGGASAEPSYTLWDLVSVGVGGTVGSGIFVLAGYIANHYAGPATFLSFAISGLAALCSGISFAEFSGRLPRIEGSTYTYAYVSMGEYAAVLAAACLTLEYGVSGAAVARSWGDKVLEWTAKLRHGEEVDHVGQHEAFFNPLAGLISLGSVVVLACGVQESKRVTNFFTVTKLLLVGIMVIGGLCFFSASNTTPILVPFDGTSYGVAGVLRGATSSFFGYLGFDEVCCLASEAKNPGDTPRAVLYTLAIVTCIYILASIALSGMLPYTEISDTSGFPNAFGALGYPFLANLTALGEVVTLPVVVLISLLAQPRLCAAMARDGLLPEIFCRRSGRDGNLFWSSILCGIPMTLLATFVPFSWMDDAISVGILFAFNMTNTALITMRCSSCASSSDKLGSRRDGGMTDFHSQTHTNEGEVVTAIDEANGIVSSSYPDPNPYGVCRGRWPLPMHLGCYHFVALAAGLTSHVGSLSSPNWSIQIGAAALTLGYAAGLHSQFPAGGTFGDASFSQMHHHDSNVDMADLGDQSNTISNRSTIAGDIFKVPFCPFLPLVGIYLNWYLISQLEWSGMVLLFVFLVIISALYGLCISGTSQTTSSYSALPQLGFVNDATVTSAPESTASSVQSFVDADGPVLLREMSMPSRRSVT